MARVRETLVQTPLVRAAIGLRQQLYQNDDRPEKSTAYLEADIHPPARDLDPGPGSNETAVTRVEYM
jgi:hypothetical protein